MRIRNIIIIVLVLSVVIAGIFLLTRKPEVHTKVFNSSPVSSNIGFPYKVDNNNLTYFTGSSFATYSLTSNSTKTITPQYALPDVSDVHIWKTGALFKASNYSSKDQLFELLGGRNSSIEYWWYCNFSDGSITLLDNLGHVIDARGDEQGIYVLAEVFFNDKMRQVVGIKPLDRTFANLTQTKIDEEIKGDEKYSVTVKRSLVAPMTGTPSTAIIETENAIGLSGVSSDRIYYERAGQSSNFHSVSFSGQDKTLDVNPHGSKGELSPDAKYLVYESGVSEEGSETQGSNINAFDVSTGKSKQIYTHMSGRKFAVAGGYAFVSSSEGKNSIMKLISIPTGETTAYSANEISNGEIVLSFIPINLNNNEFLVTSRFNKLIGFSSSKSKKSFTPNNEFEIQGGVYQNGYDIEYDTSANEYKIIVSRSSAAKNQNDAIAYIKSKGIDPNQIHIRWVLN